jgi:hypothetical protein
LLEKNNDFEDRPLGGKIINNEFEEKTIAPKKKPKKLPSVSAVKSEFDE